MAVLLTWALFVGWSAVGLGVLKLGRFRWSVATLLLAPTVGFAALVVPTYILVRFGVPVRLSAAPVAAALLLLSAVVLWRARPAAAHARRLWKRSRAFAVVLVGTFGLTAWPLVGYGFDWVAQGNDDMANYCLIATGYRDHGYDRAPTFDDVGAGRDQSHAFFLFILKEVRPGSELLLAMTSALTGLPVQPVFMPVLVALHLAMVAAAAALAVGGTRRRVAGVLTGALLGVSAASTYGVVYQLIGQASGLALLCTSLALVTARCRRLPAGVLARRAAVCGVVFSGQIVFYPEVVPLLVGGCVALGLRDLARGRLDRRHLAHAAAAIGVMAALLPVYLSGTVKFLAEQAAQGNKSATWLKELFPYFLTPRGPALVCGVLPVAGPESTRAETVGIVVGAVLLVGVAIPMLVGLRRGRAFAAALLVAAAIGASMYAQGAAFGVFKVAMFAQPFLWAVVAAWAVSRRARWSAVVAVVVVSGVAGLNARVQFWYVDQSRGAAHRVDLPAVTGHRTLSGFRAEYARRTAAGEADRVLVASNNVVLLKLLAADLRGTPTGYLGVDPFGYLVEQFPGAGQTSAPLRRRPDWHGPVQELEARYGAAFGSGGPTVTDPRTGTPLRRVLAAPPDRTAGPSERVLVVAATGGLSVLNRHRYPEGGPTLLCAPLSEVRNFAAFCDASGARQNFFGMETPDDISLHLIEADGVLRKRTMAGVGHAMVLDVVNPSPRVRVLLDYSNSFKSDPAARGVAPVEVVGDRRVSLGAVGLGAARLVSPPLGTQGAAGGHFLALDFGPATRNANKLGVAERLWGAELPRDRRALAAFARNISVISDEEYAAFRPPQQVTKFPDDLAHPHLEFSGVAEEGWIGKGFKVRLTQPAPGHEAVIRGMIPQMTPSPTDFRTELTVLLDGKPVEKRVLNTGLFEVRAPGAADAGPHWIELRFTADQQLPAPDGRRAVAHLRFAGFEPKNEALSRPPENLAAFPADLTHPKLEQTGLSADGWCADRLEARLLQSGPDRDAVIRGQIPEIAGNAAFQTELTLLLDGVEVARRSLKTGDFEVRVPAGGNAAQVRRLECRFSHAQALPPPDGRAVGALLRSVGFEPSAK